MDLTCNIHLRFVDFHLSGVEKPSDDVLFLMSTLSRIRSRQLEQVTFHCPSWTDGDFPTTEWILVDALLAGPQFAKLKTVRIYAPRYAPDSNLSALFATSLALPTCRSRSIISIHHPGIRDTHRG
jgi:hypothetical protein